MKRPKCANIKCQNDGWVNVGGDFYCGECIVKLNEKQREALREEMRCL